MTATILHPHPLQIQNLNLLFFSFFLSHDCDPKGFPHFCPIPSVLWSLALREVLPGDGKGPVRARRGRSQSAMSGMKDGPSVAIAG